MQCLVKSQFGKIRISSFLCFLFCPVSILVTSYCNFAYCLYHFVKHCILSVLFRISVYSLYFYVSQKNKKKKKKKKSVKFIHMLVQLGGTDALPRVLMKKINELWVLQ